MLCRVAAVNEMSVKHFGDFGVKMSVKHFSYKDYSETFRTLWIVDAFIEMSVKHF